VSENTWIALYSILALANFAMAEADTLRTLFARLRRSMQKKNKAVAKNPLPTYLFRTLGAASLFAGAASIMIGISFWVCAGCLYVGLLVLAIDPWLEPTLREFTISRLAVSLFFVVAIAAFTRYVVFLPAPLTVEPSADIGNYAAGTRVGGMSWEPYYTDFRITLTNRSDYDYTDLDVALITDMQVMAKGEEPLNPNVYFLDVGQHVDARMIDPTTKKEVIVKTSQNEARMRCGLFPKHSMVEIIIALVDPGGGAITDKDKYPKRLPSERVGMMLPAPSRFA
jgi:hypothetical protein